MSSPHLPRGTPVARCALCLCGLPSASRASAAPPVCEALSWGWAQMLRGAVSASRRSQASGRKSHTRVSSDFTVECPPGLGGLMEMVASEVG